MRVHAKKTFKFEKDGKSVLVVAGAFSPNLPDWIRNTKLFQLAEKEGSISVIENKAAEAALEQVLGDDKLAALVEQAKNLGIRNASTMKQSTLEARIEAALKNEETLKKLEDDEKSKEGGDNGGADDGSGGDGTGGNDADEEGGDGTDVTDTKGGAASGE